MEKKEKIIMTVTIGIMCFLLVMIIFMQFKVVQESEKTDINTLQATELRQELANWKTKYEDAKEKYDETAETLKTYKEESSAESKTKQTLEEELKKLEQALGRTDVEGEGVIITLSDSKWDVKGALNPSSLLVHDEDVLSVINELKNAGAEAISINEQRVVPSTGIICGGNVIEINKEKVGAPFEIKAIGLPEQLAGLERPYGYLEVLKEAGIQVKLERSNNITIPKYTGSITFQYAKTIK